MPAIRFTPNPGTPSHWRSRPRVPWLIVALPWILLSGPFLWALNHKFGFIGLPTHPAIFFLFIIGLSLTTVIVSLLRMRAWSAIVSAEFNVCPYCEYSLQGLAADGRCPECGEAYETSKVTAHWSKAIDHAAHGEACLRLSVEGMNLNRRVTMVCFMAALIGMGIGSLLMFGPFPMWLTVAGVALFALAMLTMTNCTAAIPRIIARLYPPASRDLRDAESQ